MDVRTRANQARRFLSSLTINERKCLMRLLNAGVILAVCLIAVGCTTTATPTSPALPAANGGSPANVRANSPAGSTAGLLDIGSAGAQGGGATIINLDLPCHFFNGDGVWSLAIGDCSFHIVFLPNGATSAELTASGQITPA